MTAVYRMTVFLMTFAVLSLACYPVTTVSADESDRWSDWSGRRTVFVQETAGLDRADEPVEVDFDYYRYVPGKDTTGLGDLVRRDIRVLAAGDDGGFTEIPCQAYDIRPSHWNRRSERPELNVDVRVAFFADVKANMTGVYRILYGNPEPPEPDYEAGLEVSGDGVRYEIGNPYFHIVTDKVSGQIDTIDLRFAGNPAFGFIHGNMHWNPDFMYTPEDFPTTWFKWYYAHNFENPPHEIVEAGPVFFEIHRSQLVPGQDCAKMEVTYRFYDRVPYFLMESRIEVVKKCHTLAIRNDELAFGSDDFTHAGWRNKTDDMLPGHVGEIGSVDIYNEARMGNHVLGSALPPNIPWISMIHAERGYGVGSIRLGWENVNVLTGEPSPIYNSHTVLSEHGNGLYWFRSLVYPQRDDYNELGWNSDDWRACCIDIPEGASYYEKNAYLFFNWSKDMKFAPIDAMWHKLDEPLRVTLR